MRAVSAILGDLGRDKQQPQVDGKAASSFLEPACPAEISSANSLQHLTILQRPAPVESVTGAATVYTEERAQLNTRISLAPTRDTAKRWRSPSHNAEDSPLASAEVLDSARSSSRNLPGHSDAQLAMTTAGSSTASPRSDGQVQHKGKRMRAKTDRRREQCRANQARYRNKQRKFTLGLKESVQQLEDEIQMLLLHRRGVIAAEKTKRDAWNVVVEYFRLFRFGLVSLEDTQGSTSTELESESSATIGSNADLLRFADTREKVAFLRSTMAPDVVFGGLQGVDALLEQWRRYSLFFENLRLQLERVEKVPGGTMEAAATLSITISSSSLRHVFPHLLQTKQGAGGLPPLGARLLGQQLRCRCSLRFVWDDASDRVVQLQCNLDLLTPLQLILRNLEDTAFVLQRALISSESVVGELEGHLM